MNSNISFTHSHTHMCARPHSQTQFSTPLGESPWLSAQCVTKPQSSAFPDSERWINLTKWNTCMCRWWEFLTNCVSVFICICTQTQSGILVSTESMWEEQFLLVSVYSVHVSVLCWAPIGHLFMCHMPNTHSLML